MKQARISNYSPKFKLEVDVFSLIQLKKYIIMFRVSIIVAN